ncbi:ribosome hibernation factor-recruiting GTPase MRF [Millisia brevis]|uniref:ribosome hibernation factor-recruiting GTPase MRF n=1 Tax=Millisia brevis TaxID=264148 RepID=UPI00082BC2DF|nr:GTP-binding protein [Millisia brevis]
MKIIVERDVVDTRTPVVILAGARDGVTGLADLLRQPGTVVVAHDLSLLREGLITRTIRRGASEWLALLEPVHGCVSCTLRHDLLPLLRTLSQRSGVARIVVALDPLLEPAEVERAIDEVIVGGIVGRIEAPAGRDVRVDAVVTAVDAATWLTEALGEDTVDQRWGIEDDRTLAQIAVAGVQAADALLVVGESDDDHGRLRAVLTRLAPNAPIDRSPAQAAVRLTGTPLTNRPSPVFDPHASLLAGGPPTEPDAGVTLVEFEAIRPFHPERLHQALDVLLDGVVTARGRLWLATQPDHVLWLESAGGGLQIASVDTWVAAVPEDDRSDLELSRLAGAALRWLPETGDRHSALVALAVDADPDHIRAALRWALLTDDELVDESRQDWEDPFEFAHHDPCDELSETQATDADDLRVAGFPEEGHR